VAGYDDGLVACTEDEVVIGGYYIFHGANRIRYGDIREVRSVPLRTMSKWRIHGSGDLVHWFNYDPGRPRKDTALVIYLDGKIKPVITPDDPARVTAELEARGIMVRPDREARLW
jgi:hypothetical protein